MDKRIAFGMKLGLRKNEAQKLACLRTPEQIQDFINAIPTNFEPDGDECKTVQETLRKCRAHCIEAALVAACALWINGEPPLLMDMQAKGDDDHVVTLFRRHGCWGAISKSNHVWLRWRDPVYRSLRELAMSYFHEYVSGSGNKTMMTYSAPFDLSKRSKPEIWVTGKDDCWDIGADIDASRHYRLVTATQARGLKPRDSVEKRAGLILEYQAPSNKVAGRY